MPYLKTMAASAVIRDEMWAVICMRIWERSGTILRIEKCL